MRPGWCFPAEPGVFREGVQPRRGHPKLGAGVDEEASNVIHKHHWKTLWMGSAILWLNRWDCLNASRRIIPYGFLPHAKHAISYFLPDLKYYGVMLYSLKECCWKQLKNKSQAVRTGGCRRCLSLEFRKDHMSWQRRPLGAGGLWDRHLSWG